MGKHSLFGGEELRLSGASSKRSFVQAELRLSGASSTSKGRGDSSTVSTFVYFLTQIQAVYAWFYTPTVDENDQRRRFVYSKQTHLLYIKITRRVAIWQIVYIGVVAASCGVFQEESESAFRITLARLGAELWGFEVLQIFRGQAGSLGVSFLAHLTLSLPWLMEL